MAVFILGLCLVTSVTGSITTGNQWNTANYTDAYLQVYKGASYIASSSPYYPPPGGTGYTTGDMTVTANFSADGTYTVKAFLDGTEIGSDTFVVPYIPHVSDAYQPTVGTKTIYLTWQNLTTGASYEVYARLSGTSTWYYKTTTSSSSATISVDNFNDYDVGVVAYVDGRSSPSYGVYEDITVADMPTLDTPAIESSSSTTTSITITLTAKTGADTYYANIDGGSWQSGSGRSFNFTGLTINTAYTIAYKCTGSGYYDSGTGSSSISTAANTRPANWSWSASNGSASAAQTQAAYNAVIKTSGYDLSDFSYLVWNDLVDKVDAFAVYKNASLVATGAKMSSGDKALSAVRFNKLLTALNAMASTGITSRSGGQLVYGSYFTTITSTLNGIT